MLEPLSLSIQQLLIRKGVDLVLSKVIETLPVTLVILFICGQLRALNASAIPISVVMK